jgi:uncharacterized protein with HEPN domain
MSHLKYNKLEAANKILSYTDGMSFRDFQQDDKTVDAVIRDFEIIGEASNSRSVPKLPGFWPR